MTFFAFAGLSLISALLALILRDRRRLNTPTLAEEYRQLWARPVLIDGEERLPVARRLE